MTTRKKKTVAEEEAPVLESDTKVEVTEEAPTPPIAETLEPEVVNQTLVSQCRHATKRNEAVIADLSRRLGEAMNLVSAVASDLDKIVRVQV